MNIFFSFYGALYIKEFEIACKWPQRPQTNRSIFISRSVFLSLFELLQWRYRLVHQNEQTQVVFRVFHSSRSVFLGSFSKYRYRMKHQQIIKSYSTFTSSNIHYTCIRYLKQIVKCLVYEKRVVMDYAQSRIPNRNFSGHFHKARKNTSNVPVVNDKAPSFIKLVSNKYLLRYHHPPFFKLDSNTNHFTICWYKR